MRVEFVDVKGSWREIADAARTTIGMEKGQKDPSPLWKRKMLLSEHSPIRQISVKWKWKNLKYWVSVHFVRHKIGIEHFVSTQRTDRTGTDRNKLFQSAPVSHECIADAQAIINISRKRLCTQASLETRTAWKALLKELKKKEPEIVSVCVPECIYRGFCPEIKSCNYCRTPAFKRQLELYRGGSEYI
jgi:hypothetical protein